MVRGGNSLNRAKKKEAPSRPVLLMCQTNSINLDVSEDKLMRGEKKKLLPLNNKPHSQVWQAKLIKLWKEINEHQREQFCTNKFGFIHPPRCKNICFKSLTLCPSIASAVGVWSVYLSPHRRVAIDGIRFEGRVTFSLQPCYPRQLVRQGAV